MRLVRLQVKHFQGVEAARIEFAAGLNVLFGPNDLGKSTLASAIRAALLVPHSSTLQKGFASWFGTGDPEVRLELCDDSGRFWRVTKTFAGTGGRSALESSKDGATYTVEGKAKEVDEKLRTLLGWGLQPPGGKGAPKGNPESFLTNTLLAPQEEVRSVLTSSLEQDKEQSGRVRLTEALGALAQDPVFKEVLDHVQRHVDQAFTPTGRLKQAAGSPLVQLKDRINDLVSKREALEQQIRISKEEEEQVARLSERKLVLGGELEEVRKLLAELQQRAKIMEQRQALRASLEEARATVSRVSACRTEIADRESKLEALEARRAAAAQAREQQLETARQAECERDAAQTQQNELLDAGGGEARKIAALGEEVLRAQQMLAERQAAAERERSALARARQLAEAVKAGAEAVERAEGVAQAAEQKAAAAADGVRAAEGELAAAKERLRIAESEERARELALRRATLEKTIAEVGQELAALEAGLVELEKTEELTAQVRTIEAALAGLGRRVEEESMRLAAARAAQGESEAALRELARLGVLGEFREAQSKLETIMAALAAADEDERQAEARLREAAEIRAGLGPDLPSAAALAELRTLREQTRVAEARLGGGLSVTMRLHRPLPVSVRRDGASEAEASADGTLTISADRSVQLVLGDVADIEVTAGEARARQAAAELSARWQREGASILQRCGVETMEALAEIVRARDAFLRRAEELDKEAEQLSGRAASGRVRMHERASLEEQVRELAEELEGAAAEALTVELRRLGKRWRAEIKQRRAELEAQQQVRERSTRALADEEIRLRTQRDGCQQELERARAELRARLEALGEDWQDLRERRGAARSRATQQLSELQAQLQELETTAEDGAAALREAAVAAQRALSACKQEAEREAEAARRARDAAVAASTESRLARDLAGCSSSCWVTAPGQTGGKSGTCTSWRLADRPGSVISG
jgi:chromosome segregation ATPase